jgi:SMODS-associated and fused to various effectors sensor domain
MSGTFGEMCHIIGASKDGPRGNSDSEVLAKNPKNIILLCKDHHTLVDDNPYVFTVEGLRKMKDDHEQRIKKATAISTSAQTEILIFKSNIGNRPVDVDLDEAKRTIFNRGYYPASDNGLVIDRTREDGDGEDHYWGYNKTKIIEDVTNMLFPKTNSSPKIKHLSIFALGPIPYLILLGKHITSTGISKIEVLHRNRDLQSWEWPNDIDPTLLPEYEVIRPVTKNSNCEPVLCVALSDAIAPDKFQDMINSSQDVYTITLKGVLPNRSFCKHPDLVINFVTIFHTLLNELQAIYGYTTKIHLLPAIPNAIAVHCGMALLPKKEMPILIYDLNKDYGAFRPIFEV